MMRPARCRYCDAPLPPLLAMQGDVCGASTCRLRAGHELLTAQRSAALDALRADAARRLDDRVRDAAVVWLRHHETTLVETRDDERADMAAHLERLVASADAAPVEADPPADVAPSPAVDGAVCAFCRGRCCRDGGGWHAFIDHRLLRRRQARHGGTVADAAAHYLAMLPADHVADSCLYAGDRGCALPRDERAPTCNHHACSGLHEARRRIGEAPERGAVIATLTQGRLVDAAWLDVDAAGTPRATSIACATDTPAP